MEVSPAHPLSAGCWITPSVCVHPSYGFHGKWEQGGSADVGDWRAAWVELFPGWALESWQSSGPVLTGEKKTTRPSFSSHQGLVILECLRGPVRCELTFYTDVLCHLEDTSFPEQKYPAVWIFALLWYFFSFSVFVSIFCFGIFIFRKPIKRGFCLLFDRADSRVSGEMLWSSLVCQHGFLLL